MRLSIEPKLTREFSQLHPMKKRLTSLLLLGGVLAIGWMAMRAPRVQEPVAQVTGGHAVSTPATIMTPPAVVAAVDAPLTVNATPDLVGQITTALRSGSTTERDRAWQQLLPELVRTDPSAAGHLALAWEQGAMRDELLERTIRLWSETDIGGTLTWLTSLLDQGDRDLAALSATTQVAQTDPAGALELAQSLRIGLDDGRFERMAQLWAEEFPQDAVDWATAQPAGALRDKLLIRIVHVRAQQDPPEAARLATAQFAPGANRDNAILTVIRHWAVRDQAAATLWAGSFDSGSLRDRAFSEIRNAGVRLQM
ncbi:hypothetical protein ESB00_04060 [Oleiharenicola lentus]|uniref:Uncharacterized protein n=1 Tax=Oleiharenicola lentus TaxID=2508720 RepID=A0A4Q1C824_9BACT|nr:hypothetical protein [Oleiharenicola lentus]RXK55084.1 hypothetical protein ESB00_04060 [Oleiharenicola lentus]